MTLPNPQQHVVSTAVLTKSKLVLITTARQVTTAVTPTNVTRLRIAKTIITKPHSPPRRNINRSPSPNASTFPPKVTTAKAPMDKGVIDIGCSRHMTVSMSHLFDFEEINSGYVAFGGNPKGGKISGIGKFDGNANEGFLVGYSVSSKAFKVFNSRTRIVQETLHINFLENKPNIASSGPTWLFDIDTLTKTMNYQPVTVGNQSNLSVGVQELFDAEKAREDNAQQYVLFPVWSFGSKNPQNTHDDAAFGGTNTFSAGGPSNNVVSPTHGKSSYMDPSQYPDDPNMPKLKDIIYSDDEEDVGAEADFTNLDKNITISPIPTTKVHKDHPVTQIISDLSSATQTRSMTRVVKDQGGLSQINNDEFHTCMFSCFLSQEEPKRDKGINYEEVFSLVARIESIRLFLAYASFMGFMVYQMDVKSAFMYGTIEEEVYVYQPPGFEDPDYPDNAYKVVKALYGLHQAPRACKAEARWDIISQDKYVAKILRKFGLTDGKPAGTPIDTEKHLLKDIDGEDVDVHTYRSMIGSLMYLTSSRLDIMFAVHACARFQVTPKVSHLHAVKRIYRYLKGKPHLGLWYPKDSPFSLVAYLDSDYAGASLDRKSTTGGCQFLRCRLICWQCKKQTVIATSSTEAEYVAAAKLSRMGYEKHFTKLTFYKAFFLPQWKFLIHPILQCMSAKRTSWNEFSSSMALAVICLSTGRKFNFSKAQVGDLSSHSTKYSSRALTQKVFANMRRVGKGFSGVETSLLEAMIVAQQADDVADEGATDVDVDFVPAAVDEPFIPSPIPNTQPLPPSQELPSTSQVLPTSPPSPISQPPRVEHLEQDKISQTLEITNLEQRVKKLERRNKLKVSKLRRLKKLGTAQRVDTSEDTVMDDVSKQDEIIANKDVDEDVILKDVAAVAKEVEIEKTAKIEENADVQGRQAESQAQIYKIDLEHADKVLSMQDDKLEPTELKEVVEVVTIAKLMTEVVTAASATITVVTTPITAATITDAPSAARRRKGVVIRDLEETVALSIIIHTEPKSKDKGKGIMVEEPKHLKKQAQIKQDEAYARELEAELNKTINWDDVIDQVRRKEKEDNVVMRYQALKRKPQTEVQARKNMMIYLRNMTGFKMNYFKRMSYDDICLIFKKYFNSNVAFLEKIKEPMEEEDNKALKRASESQAKKAAQKQKLDEEVEEIKKHLQIVPNDEDDVYTKATPLAHKVPVVDYEIYTKNNKPYYKIIRADGSP
nr:hypothetical protein [Tanacetum cinerariifolium]